MPWEIWPPGGRAAGPGQAGRERISMKIRQATSRSSASAWTRPSRGCRSGSAEWAHRRPRVRARGSTALLTVSFSGTLSGIEAGVRALLRPPLPVLLSVPSPPRATRTQWQESPGLQCRSPRGGPLCPQHAAQKRGGCRRVRGSPPCPARPGGQCTCFHGLQPPGSRERLLGVGSGGGQGSHLKNS